MLVNISQIKVNERIRKDFGNIEELANDIKENGLINPPVVTPDNELIAGERRLRACKSLGYQQIEVRAMSVKDSEHQLQIEISENENRKDFTFSERIDWARRLDRVEKIKAKERQELGVVQNSAQGRTRDIVADKSGFGSHDTLNKAKYISENATENMIKDLDAGKLSINNVYTSLKKEKESLETQLQQVKNIKPKTIDNTDYITITKLESDLTRKNKDIEFLKRDKDILDRKVKLNEADAKKYTDMKKQIDELTHTKEDIKRQIDAATSISGLVVQINNLIKTQLAPVKYSKAILEMQTDVIVIRNLTEIIEVVELWCGEMKEYLPNNNIINVEVKNYNE